MELNKTVVSIKQMKEKSNDPIVYVTKTGKCFHEKTCGLLKYSKRAYKLLDAISEGYEQCSYCFKEYHDINWFICAIPVVLFFAIIIGLSV